MSYSRPFRKGGMGGFDFEILLSFDIGLPAAGRDFDI
jgi:hypothetical protein